MREVSVLPVSSSEFGEVALLGEYCCAPGDTDAEDKESGFGISGGGGGGNCKLNFFILILKIIGLSTSEI